MEEKRMEENQEEARKRWEEMLRKIGLDTIRGGYAEVYREMAKRADAHKRCLKGDNDEWAIRHAEAVKDLMELLPHGYGINGDWTLDFAYSGLERIRLHNSFDAMTEYGMYDRTIHFSVTVRGHLGFGIDVRVRGNFGNLQDIKEYLEEVLA